jgi:renalase
MTDNIEHASMADAVILGSGMAGLACGRHLAKAGQNPVILDKGRGVGGRMATRRIRIGGQDLSFDHGAQYFTARDPDFSALVETMATAIAPWDDDGPEPRFVGLPGMSGLPKALASALHVRQGVEVTGLHRDGPLWMLDTGAETIATRRLVMTIPAPQAARLLGPAHPFHARLAGIVMAPCLTLMAAFPAEAPRPFQSRASETHPLAWIAQDSSKPARNRSLTTWVAQASPAWSGMNLEEDPETIAARMLPLLAAAIGASPDDAQYAVAHRWRFARVVNPLGQPFLRSEDGTLWLGGDWCLGARVEAAWMSGNAIASDVLKAMHAE